MLTEKPGLADRVLVVVKNDGKFLGWRRFGRLLGDRDVIGEFGLATKAAIGRIFLRSPPFGWTATAGVWALPMQTIRPFAVTGRMRPDRAAARPAR